MLLLLLLIINTHSHEECEFDSKIFRTGAAFLLAPQMKGDFNVIMKKKNLFITAALSVLLGLGMAAGIGSASSKKAPVQVEAASTMVTGTKIFVEDRWTSSGWTDDGIDACLHIYSPSFKSGSGYSSFADVKLNDMYAVSFATDGSTYMDVRMKWTSGSYRQYEAIMPWYLSGFTYEFYATKNSEDRYVCNKNGGKKFSFTAEYGKAISVCFKDGSWGGSSYYCNNEYYSSNNYTYEFNGIKSGSHMYLSTSDISGWEWDNAKIAICFGKSNINNGQAWSCQYNAAHTALSTTFCWKVQGSGDDHLFECIVPQFNGQDVYWSMVIGVRFSSSASAPGWSNVLNQSGDQFYNGDDRDCNMLWVNPATGGGWSGGGYLRNDRTISDDTRAGYYGTYFLSQITCDGAGNITSASSNWTNVKNEYKQHLSTAVEGKVWTSSAAASGTDLVKAMYRYDYIVFHKGYSGYDDFINRATSSGKSFTKVNWNVLGINDSQSTTTFLIVIVAIASVAAISGYFFIRKKKNK